MKKNEIFKINYETFDYYNLNPRDFNELLERDKNLLQTLVGNIDLYAFSIVYLIRNDIGLWDFHAEPSEADDFKYVCHFNNSISEHRIQLDNDIDKDEKFVLYGISKISIDFYLENYAFFNGCLPNYLLVAGKKDILNIENKIDEIMKKIFAKDSYYRNKYIFDFIDKIKIPKKVGQCILISFKDDEEFKEVRIVNQE